MDYESLEFKVPREAGDYGECSEFVTTSIEGIMNRAIEDGRNKILIHTSLRLGLPMENINKIAGPFIEAWAQEVFTDVLEDADNEYHLVGVKK